MLPILCYANGPVFIAFLSDIPTHEAVYEHFAAANPNEYLGKTSNATHRESIKFSITSGDQADEKVLSHLQDVTDMRKWNGLLEGS